MIVRKCLGCGAILQNEYPEKAGYVPVIKAEGETYCKRCFRLKNYNELPKIVANNKQYEHVIDSVVNKNGLMILIVDLFDFAGSFTKEITDKLRGKDVIIVANKYDIFPKSTNPAKIVEWISKACEKIFFRVIAIHIISATKGYFLDDLMHTIDLFRKDRDCYIVGCANVGKSTFINQMLRKFTSKSEDVIATSVIPGTTLGQITIPFFEDNKAFIDTPGLINEKNILQNILPASYKKILPTAEINPITYQLKSGNAIFAGGICCLDYVSGEINPVICYFARSLEMHRTKSEKVDYFFQTHVGSLLTPPTKEEVDKLEYETFVFKLDGKKKKDIVISGLGFFSIMGAGTFKLTTIKNTGVFVRDAIIGK